MAWIVVAEIKFVESVGSLERPFPFQRLASSFGVQEGNRFFDVEPLPFDPSLNEEDEVVERLCASEDHVGLFEVEMGHLHRFGKDLDLCLRRQADRVANEVFADGVLDCFHQLEDFSLKAPFCGRLDDFTAVERRRGVEGSQVAVSFEADGEKSDFAVVIQSPVEEEGSLVVLFGEALRVGEEDRSVDFFIPAVAGDGEHERTRKIGLREEAAERDFFEERFCAGERFNCERERRGGEFFQLAVESDDVELVVGRNFLKGFVNRGFGGGKPVGLDRVGAVDEEGEVLLECRQVEIGARNEREGDGVALSVFAGEEYEVGVARVGTGGRIALRESGSPGEIGNARWEAGGGRLGPLCRRRAGIGCFNIGAQA